MSQKIEIGVIPQDLRHEETIIQIAQSLDNLESAVSHIFNCINSRISENGKTLESIRERAQNVQAQLEYLQTHLSLKAVKIFSASKYPASHTYREYPVVIKSKPKENSLSASISETLNKHLVSLSKTENGQLTSTINIQEKLQFYYVKSESNNRIAWEKANYNNILPKISSISALMLSKTSKQSSDYLSRSLHHKTDPKKYLEDTPDSILQPWHSSETDSLSSYLYAPTLGDVPQINVPLCLPDLPGIVDDEKFVPDLNFQDPIAPSSAAITPTVQPDQSISISAAGEKSSTFIPDGSIFHLPNFSDYKTSSDVVLPPPPPPPPLNVEKSTINQTAVTAPSSPPPPPPPLPSNSSLLSANLSIIIDHSSEIKERKISLDMKNPVADNRMNLMAEIRNAGGIGRAKLRRTVPAEKVKDRFSSASVGGDLMADLHAKLSMRRKGIAGSGMNAFERMSSMIPPPPLKPNEISDRNSVTSEGDSLPDNDEWEE